MEDLFDILIPLISAGVYFIGNVLSRTSGDALDETGQPLSRERDQEEDLEDAERQREVQEEIRRMIEERRNDAPANPTPEPQAEPARMVRERASKPMNACTRHVHSYLKLWCRQKRSTRPTKRTCRHSWQKSSAHEKSGGFEAQSKAASETKD